MGEDLKKHPLNIVGKYYVTENCTCMGACADIAPDIFKDGSDTEYGFYVARQPENRDEEDACQEAMMCCAFEAIRDDGNESRNA